MGSIPTSSSKPNRGTNTRSEAWERFSRGRMGGGEYTVIIEIRGRDLPGPSCGPTTEGGRYPNIHVGLARGKDTIDLVPGDAESARWELEVKVKDGPDGGFDCTGPSVFGSPGQRHLALRWVTVADDGSTSVFRAAKLRLDDIDPGLPEEAIDRGGRLVVSLGLTDERGWPRCASVRPPLVTWSVG